MKILHAEMIYTENLFETHVLVTVLNWTGRARIEKWAISGLSPEQFDEMATLSLGAVSSTLKALSTDEYFELSSTLWNAGFRPVSCEEIDLSEYNTTRLWNEWDDQTLSRNVGFYDKIESFKKEEDGEFCI